MKTCVSRINWDQVKHSELSYIKVQLHSNYVFKTCGWKAEESLPQLVSIAWAIEEHSNITSL